ncbi:MAG: hypothetical protein ABID63_16190, partial [Pseudomonadota bacterium]
MFVFASIRNQKITCDVIEEGLKKIGEINNEELMVKNQNVDLILVDCSQINSESMSKYLPDIEENLEKLIPLIFLNPS